jgi:hypothetical protein
MIENPESSCWIPGSPALRFGAPERRSGSSARCDRVRRGESISATVEVQVTAIAPDVSSIVPQIHSVAADIRQVSREIGSIAGSQIPTEIAEILPQVGTIAANILSVRTEVLPIGSDVGSVSIRASRSNGRSQSGAGDHRGGDEGHRNYTHHDTSPSASPPTDQRPPLCARALNESCVAGSPAVNQKIGVQRRS